MPMMQSASSSFGSGHFKLLFKQQRHSFLVFLKNISFCIIVSHEIISDLVESADILGILCSHGCVNFDMKITLVFQI